MMRGTKRGRRTPRRRGAIWALAALGVCLAGAGLALRAGVAGANLAGQPAATPTPPASYPAAPGQSAAVPVGRVYFVAREAQGFVLMRSDVAGASVPVAPFPGGFGAEASDSVGALALAPGDRWLAIDAQRDHGDNVWVLDTATGRMHDAPADASGNFLRWLPDGAHFLFRPFLPAGPVVGAWSPGLWIVDAATGGHVNIALPAGLTALDVVDAAPAPDGTRLIFSTSAGLGLGSAVWAANVDGGAARELFQAPGVVGLFAWSPDGSQIAYEQLADTPAPYQTAALWLLNAATLARQPVGTADGGHGFLPAWSPDGSQLAYVARLNPGDPLADARAGRLVSAVQVFDAATGQTTTAAGPDQTGQPRNVAPQWQANGALSFTALAASDGPGAAQTDATLWLATPRATGDTRTFLAAPLSGAGFAGAVALVSVGG